MTSAHVIEDLCFDIGFDAESAAFDAQEQLAAFAQGRAQRIIGEVFDEASHDGQVLRFEVLDIDLGPVVASNLTEELSTRLRERLADALRNGSEAVRNGAQPGAPRVEQTSPAQADVELLLHFMEHGVLPWWAAAGSPVELSELVARVLADSGPQLVQAVRQAADRRRWLQRLAAQLPETLLVELARRIAPAAFDAVAGTIDGLSATARQGTPRVMLRRRLWAAAFDRLLDVTAAPSSLHGPGAQVEVALADTENVREAVQQARMRAWIEAAGDDEPARSAMDPLGLIDVGVWNALIRAEPEWAAQALQRIGRTRRGRRRLARSLPAAAWPALLGLWLESDQVGCVLDAMGYARPERDAAGRPGEGSEADRWRAPAEMLLAYLLVDGGAQAFSESALQDRLKTRDAACAADAVAGESTAGTPKRSAQRRRSATAAAATAGASEEENTPTPAAKSEPEAPLSGAKDMPPMAGLASEEAEALALLRARFEAALAGGGASSVALAWQALASIDTQAVPACLWRVLGASQGLRQNAARSWPDALLRDVVRALRPPEQDWIETIVQCLVTTAVAESRRVEPGEPTAGATPEEDVCAAVWEWTLNQLFAPPGRGLDEHRYLAGAASAAARALGIAPSRLAAAALRGLREQAPSDPVQPRLGAQRAERSAIADGTRELLCYLQGAPATAMQTESMLPALQTLTQEQTGAARTRLLAALESPLAAGRLSALLDPDGMVRLTQWLRPGDGASAAALSEWIAAASARARDGPDAEQLARASRQFVLRELFEEGRRFDVAGFAVRLAEALEEVRRPHDAVEWRRRLAASIADRGALAAAGMQFSTRARNGDEPDASDAASLARTAAEAIAASAETQRLRGPLAAPASPPLYPEPTFADEAAIGERVYIGNAGIVLLAPYLPRLFAMLGLANERAFVSEVAVERAIHVVQFVVTGSAETPEPLLALNKLLCGVPLEAPIVRQIELTGAEQAVVEDMLRAVIEHWSAIGRTSIAGLRESFLQREGRLARGEDGWMLRVEPRAFDMLIDRLPWGFATIKYPWMERVIHVDWR